MSNRIKIDLTCTDDSDDKLCKARLNTCYLLSSSYVIFIIVAPIAQSVELSPMGRKVVGSKPGAANSAYEEHDLTCHAATTGS